MATVTGLTAQRMLAIEAASVVSGAINASGHLILTTHDGTQIDAGNALVAVPQESVVNILPAGSQGFTEQIEPHIYPQGLSLIYITDTTNQGWGSLGFVSGTVQSMRIPDPTDGLGRVSQFFQNHTGLNNEPDIWIRTGIEMFGWTAWRKLATQKYVDDNLNTRINPIGIKAESAPITEYPRGLSMMAQAGSSGPAYGTIPDTQYGTIITAYDSGLRAFQLMQVEDGYLHFRRYRSDVTPSWRPWTKVLTEHRLSAANYSQGAAFTSYPWGISYLYLNNTESSSGGWEFSGLWGMVTTYRYSDDFAVQTFQKHQGGTGAHTALWQRTASSANGWSRWFRLDGGVLVVKDQALPTIVPGVAAYTINLPSGKSMIDTNYVIQFYVTEHNTNTFGSAYFTPVGARPSTTTSFLIRINSSGASNLSGFISYTLTPVQG